MRPHLGRAVALAGGLGSLLAFGAASPVLAHGPVPAEPPTVLNLVLGWTLEPAVALPLLAAALGWIWIVRRIDRLHPASPVPRRRSVAFLGGLAVIAIALMSGIDTYDTTLFSVHMVQHLLLTLVAAPLIVLGAPITTVLRVATPNVRRTVILPILHSRVLRILTFPVVAWVIFAGVMWGTHFSPIFNRSLEDPVVHDLEHALYVGAGLLFWWPAVGSDPSPWRMPHPVRAMYVFLQMPQNTFLAVTILNSSVPLYPHYATEIRSWGPTALEDQQIAGGLMWLCGDLLFLAAILAIVAAWMAHEKREEAAVDRRVDRQREAIRVRETRLAERLAEERDGR
ncbi:MAG TPA: cytochrome c oxidase assembly protein [Candidatus Limnocylindrales bacterium]|jgi:putative copper resistance protein D|nr:cytochrome c oxidase assembly protein [Candidatus Limnocylindrales bacterium]